MALISRTHTLISHSHSFFYRRQHWLNLTIKATAREMASSQVAESSIVDWESKMWQSSRIAPFEWHQPASSIPTELYCNPHQGQVVSSLMWSSYSDQSCGRWNHHRFSRRWKRKLHWDNNGRLLIIYTFSPSALDYFLICLKFLICSSFFTNLSHWSMSLFYFIFVPYFSDIYMQLKIIKMS